MDESEVFDEATESVVSEDATVEAVIAEETVNNTADAVVEVEEPELVEEPVPDLLVIEPEPEPVVEEEIVPPLEEVEEVITKEGFILKLGHNLWFQNWKPYRVCTKKADDIVLDADWERGYCSSLDMVKHIKAEIVKL